MSFVTDAVQLNNFKSLMRLMPDKVSERSCVVS